MLSDGQIPRSRCAHRKRRLSISRVTRVFGVAVALSTGLCAGCQGDQQGTDPPLSFGRLAVTQHLCDFGIDAGCFSAGQQHHFGIGTPKNGEKALALYRRACLGGGDLEYCQWLTLTYVSGYASMAALRFLSGDFGHRRESGPLEPDGELRLAKTFCDDVRSGAIKPAKAGDFVRNECATMVQEAHDAYADAKATLPGLTTGCDGAIMLNCALLGGLRLLGVGVPGHLQTGSQLLDRACAGGYEPACAESRNPLFEASVVGELRSQAKTIRDGSISGDSASSGRSPMR